VDPTSNSFVLPAVSSTWKIKPRNSTRPSRRANYPPRRREISSFSPPSKTAKRQITGVRLLIERISAFLGSPAYFACAVVLIVLWTLANGWAAHAGWHPVDPPPFFWLQGLVSSNALLLTVAVLIRQNRMSQVAEHRAHLDLQINLLSEQKVTKILQIIAELHRELTALRVHPDSEVAEMTKPADAHALMHAIKQEQSTR
jgi:uncharacterized membrane protein